MKREFVRDWMTPDPLTIDPGVSVSGAYRLMKERAIRRLPVVEGDRLVGIVTLGDLRALVGILTESDIFRLVAQHWSENEGAIKEPGG
jgi:CBS domain-containing protein